MIDIKKTQVQVGQDLVTLRLASLMKATSKAAEEPESPKKQEEEMKSVKFNKKIPQAFSLA